MLAERFRIVGLLGRGGMGEVYRADDLTLAQPVALKFLPPALEEDEVRLDRLLNEVRTARRISHPNVCRVYDIAQEDGHHFLSMEYVDGEDLATLLKRIGRLEKDKALETARQLCAGLAAAHGQGVLHRDLKPANVMIDGRGGVRIMDFGLAGLAEEMSVEEARSGTPGYMAPEQFRGEGVSVKSDLYALGLVLYELFTGKKAFEAGSAMEMARLQKESTPTTPSSLVDGFDPVVEQVILRCLDKDPAQRPASALAVAASLPGGDPLAAALAAGETPSPEMVAAAGDVGGLKPAWGITLLTLTIVGLLAGVFLGEETFVLGHVAMPLPPEALAANARKMIEEFGYTETPVDSAYGFYYDQDHIGELAGGIEPGNWESLGAVRPSLVSFWYRQAPRHLVPENHMGQLSRSNPRTRISGTIDVTLSPNGWLERFLAVPPQVDESGEEPEETDWLPLFTAAGISMENWAAVAPTWNPLVNSLASASTDGGGGQSTRCHGGQRLRSHSPGQRGSRGSLAVTAELAPGPRRSPGSISAGLVRLRLGLAAVVASDPPRANSQRGDALPRGAGAGPARRRAGLAHLHGPGALRPAPVAGCADLLEPPSGRSLARSPRGDGHSHRRPGRDVARPGELSDPPRASPDRPDRAATRPRLLGWAERAPAGSGAMGRHA
jgi:serine/threonine-protein kinase